MAAASWLWLRTFLDLPNGIPVTRYVPPRVHVRSTPTPSRPGLWPGLARSLVVGFEREVVAIDGKTIRRSFDHVRDQSPLQVVSAWASEQGLVLGKRCVDGKSNEITAVPELLDQLALQNSIVTLDAMGCQTVIAEKILAARGRLPAGAQRQPPVGSLRRWPRISTSTAFAVAHPAVPTATRSTTRMAAWSAAGYSPAPRLDEPGRPERLAGPAHPAGSREHPQRQQRAQGRKRDPLPPVELPRQSGRPGPGDPFALGGRKCPALGAGCDVPRGRQPRA